MTDTLWQFYITLIGFITGIMEVIRMGLLQTIWFRGLEAARQSLYLQLISMGVGAGIAISYQANALLFSVAWGTVPGLVGMIITGIGLSFGAAGAHLLFAAIGVRVGMAAPVQSAPPLLVAQNLERGVPPPVPRQTLALWL